MRDVLPDLARWWHEGHAVGMATVVETFHSAPREPGASMIVGPGGLAIGSVSGGCVEGAVYDLAQSVAISGRPSMERYGVSSELAYSVGLTCGGVLDVFVECVDQQSFPDLGDVVGDVEAGRPVAIATVLKHSDPRRVGRRLVVRPEWGDLGTSGSLGSARLDSAVTADARGLLATGSSKVLVYRPDDKREGEEARVFVTSFAPRPRMIVFGAIDFAASMARIGGFLGYRVTVCDARPVFATDLRFPFADEVVVQWPHKYLNGEIDGGRIDARTVICVLTHDPKFDLPLLKVALRLPETVYVGAMGSRRTHEGRVQSLLEEGLSESQVARLASPIGLDLGGRTPEETAISIAAEIISLRWGGTGSRLSDVSGAIHHRSLGPGAFLI